VAAIAYEFGRRGLRRLAVIGIAGIVAVIVVAFALRTFAPPSHTVGVKPPSTAHQAPPESIIDRITGARWEAWQTTVALIASRPLPGYGFGTGDRVFARYPARTQFVFFEGNNPNDAYLQAILELGVLALVFFSPFALALRLAVRAVLRRADDVVPFAALMLASLAAAVVESTLESSGAPWAFFAWLAAAALLADKGGASRSGSQLRPGREHAVRGLASAHGRVDAGRS
jgi:hypothetical protein